VEVLGGALAGGAVEDKAAARNWGSLVIALDPAALGDAAAFRRRVSALLRRVKAARKAPGVDDILLPGERSLRAAGIAPPPSPALLCRVQPPSAFCMKLCTSHRTLLGLSCFRESVIAAQPRPVSDTFQLLDIDGTCVLVAFDRCAAEPCRQVQSCRCRANVCHPV
jgi:hypothetical protein